MDDEPRSLWIVHFDASFRERVTGRRVAWAWVAYREGEEIAHEFDVVVHPLCGGANCAEFLACAHAARWAHALSDDLPVRFVGDAARVIEQLAGTTLPPKASPEREYWREIREAGKGRRWSFEWVPRNQNRRADALCKKAWGEAWVEEMQRLVEMAKAERRAAAMESQERALAQKARQMERAMTRLTVRQQKQKAPASKP